MIAVGLAIVCAGLVWREPAPEPCEIVVAVAAPRPAPPPPQILYVDDGRSTGAFRQALTSDGMAVTAAELPASAAALAAYDLVIVSDVPAHLLTDDRRAALAGYVAGGGAVLMAGGEDSFGTGGYQATTMERLMPVRFDSGSRESPDVAVVVVVDRSAPLESVRRAARTAVEALSPGDYFAVVAFDREASTVVRPQRAAHRSRIAIELARLTPDEGGNLHGGLRAAYEILDHVRASTKHVVILASSEPTSVPLADRELATAMRDAHITISAVDLADTEPAHLARIAELGEGRIYTGVAPGALGAVVAKDLALAQRAVLAEDHVRVRVAKQADAIAGTAVERAPPLRGYVSMRSKPTAEVILMSGIGEPLLARWCSGAGTVVAWASDLDHEWSTEWTRWDGYAKLWAQVVRSSLRGTHCRR